MLSESLTGAARGVATAGSFPRTAPVPLYVCWACSNASGLVCTAPVARDGCSSRLNGAKTTAAQPGICRRVGRCLRPAERWQRVPLACR